MLGWQVYDELGISIILLLLFFSNGRTIELDAPASYVFLQWRQDGRLGSHN